MVESGNLCKPHALQMYRDGAIRPLRVNSVGSVSENCEILAATGHAPDDLLCKCTECDREYRKRLHIKTRYGLSWEDYLGLLAFQGEACAVCRSVTPRGKGVWHVDHDHKCCPQSSESCGKCVRGILCSPCNSYGVAWYEALPEHLQTFDILNLYLRHPPAKRYKQQGPQRKTTDILDEGTPARLSTTDTV
ncbi:endonuclease domain-containing protein [Streptomyces althioticus]|uniref:endonuclease domain-containing protein n=1 Tax=Streptomyces althioticus TaxID=83380 RepID=UPI003688B46A